MSNGSNGSGALGNTKPKPKRTAAAKKWCFTFNNYKEDELNSLITLMKNGSNNYIFGLEVGEKTKTPHIQGYINFSSKIRPLEDKQFEPFKKRIHWEQCKGSEEDNIKYCSKSGNYKTNFKIKKPLKILEEKNLYDWQREIYELCKTEPDDRSIYWYWDEKGNIGKTQLCKFLSHHLGAVPVDGKKNDILYVTAMNEADIYIFDFERSTEDFISYSAIEKVKNGYYMCGKYEGKSIVRNSPHIICFANFEPEKDKLSADRWKIKKLDNQSKTKAKEYAFIEDALEDKLKVCFDD